VVCQLEVHFLLTTLVRAQIPAQPRFAVTGVERQSLKHLAREANASRQAADRPERKFPDAQDRA